MSNPGRFVNLELLTASLGKTIPFLAPLTGLEVLFIQGDAPFYREVGFFSPHAPFMTPKRFKDMYTPSAFEYPSEWDGLHDHCASA